MYRASQWVGTAIVCGFQLSRVLQLLLPRINQRFVKITMGNNHLIIILGIILLTPLVGTPESHDQLNANCYSYKNQSLWNELTNWIFYFGILLLNFKLCVYNLPSFISTITPNTMFFFLMKHPLFIIFLIQYLSELI